MGEEYETAGDSRGNEEDHPEEVEDFGEYVSSRVDEC